MAWVLAALMGASCQAGGGVPAASMVIASATARLHVVVGEAGRSVQYLPAADWAFAECVLENEDPAIAPQTVRAAAAIDPATGRRQAIVAFDHVTPASGYRVRLALKAAAQGGEEPVVAELAEAGLDLAPGLNTVTLSGRPKAAAGQAMAPSSLGAYVSTLSTGGPAASFRSPSMVLFDAAGQAVVLDETSLRRLGPDAAGRLSVSTLAGSYYMQGYLDGTGTEARFHSLRGAAFGSDGTLYVTDGHRVREVLFDGAGRATVTTVAGDVQPGSADGPAEAARFNTLTGLAVDQQGTIFVIDAGNRTLRRIDRDEAGRRVVSTLRDGEEPLRFTTTMEAGLALDSQNHLLLVTQAGLTRVRWAPGGPPRVEAIAGSTPGFADGKGTAAKFLNPGGLALGQGQAIYLADAGNGRIRRVDPNGAVSTVAGGAITGREDGPVATARFMRPTHVAVDHEGRLYATDENRLRVIEDGVVSTVAGGLDQHTYHDGPARPTIGLSPVDMAAAADGTVYAAAGHRIWKITVDALGRASATAVAGGEQPGYADGAGAVARFRAPTHLGFDGQGRLLVADAGNFRLRRISFGKAGAAVTTIAGTGSNGEQDGPVAQVGLAPVGSFVVGEAGEVIYAERTRLRRLSFDANGAASVTTLAGAPYHHGIGFLDGPGAVARFGELAGLAVGPEGTIYVSDSSNNTIRAVATGASGTVTVSSIAGVGRLQAGFYQGISFADGRGPEAAFNVPGDLAIDAGGTLYVADRNNHRVRAITGLDSSPWVTTLAGGAPGFKDGPAGQARLQYPSRLSIDGRGHLYVLEGNSEMQLRKIAR
ncbi:MAG: hypothetical protein ACLGIN_05195 [Candidatus Sericytochromatia bacterium]